LTSKQQSEYSRPYSLYALGVLFFVNMLNMADRAILGVLLESIRLEMYLTDTQVGLMTGFAFALFYALAGIYISRLSDRFDRRVVLGLSILVWSAMTAVTASVHSFWQLFIARVGVGIGESSAVPTSNALIADYFAPAKRPFALAVFTAGSFGGILLGSTLGGYVGGHFGWRWAFVMAAILGLPIAILTFATLRDPSRDRSDGRPLVSLSIGETLRTLIGFRAFLLLIVSAGFITYMVYGITSWFPAFLMRKHNMTQADGGLLFGVALGIGTALGTLAGGVAATRLAKRSLSWLTRLPLLLSLFCLPLYELAIYAPNASIALIFFGAASAIGGAILGPLLAAIQTILPTSMRAIGASLTGFSGSLIGLGGAPLVVGVLSDYFATSMDTAAALQRALAFAVLASLPTSWLLFRADVAFRHHESIWLRID